MGSPRASEVSDGPTGPIVAGHLVGLAREAGLDPPDHPGPAWYQQDLPATLSQALTGGPFDAIVLDEAQDLSDMWMLALDGLLAPDGRWYAFADRHQDLFASRASLPDFLDLTHELRENFRNSRPIAEFASQFGPTELDCVSPEGPPVRFVAVSDDRVIDRAEREAGRLQRTERIPEADLALLWLFHNPMRGRNDEVADRQTVGGEQLLELFEAGEQLAEADLADLVGAQAQEAVLSDLHDALGRRHQADHQGLARAVEGDRQGHAGHDRNVGGLHAPVREVDGGRRLRGAADAHQHDVGLVEIDRQLAVVVQQREGGGSRAGGRHAAAPAAPGRGAG